MSGMYKCHVVLTNKSKVLPPPLLPFLGYRSKSDQGIEVSESILLYDLEGYLRRDSVFPNLFPQYNGKAERKPRPVNICQKSDKKISTTALKVL